MSEPEGLGADLIFGGPDEPQPNWRDGDPDDDLDDNEDPEPIAPDLLAEMLGFDVDEEFDEDDEDDGEGEDEDEDDAEEEEADVEAEAAL